MRILLSAFQRQRPVHSSGLIRIISSQPYTVLVDDHDDTVLVEGNRRCMTAVLNRPSVLNALNTSMEIEAARTNEPWCISTLKQLKEASPLSLKVSLRSIREGRFQTLDQSLIREYRMSVQGTSKQISGDFCEGVRAQMLDKDYAPKWDTPKPGTSI